MDILTERMLVAVPCFGHHATVLSYQGECIKCEIDYVSAFLDDLGINYPKEIGLWIWEGIPKWVGDEEGETNYNDGTWRRPNIKELEKIQSNECIWPEIITYFCSACGNEQDELEPCHNCNGLEMVSSDLIRKEMGADWLEKFKKEKQWQ
jgi:hypothetical protein